MTTDPHLEEMRTTPASATISRRIGTPDTMIGTMADHASGIVYELKEGIVLTVIVNGAISMLGYFDDVQHALANAAVEVCKAAADPDGYNRKAMKTAEERVPLWKPEDLN